MAVGDPLSTHPRDAWGSVLPATATSSASAATASRTLFLRVLVRPERLLASHEHLVGRLLVADLRQDFLRLHRHADGAVERALEGPDLARRRLDALAEQEARALVVA